MFRKFKHSFRSFVCLKYNSGEFPRLFAEEYHYDTVHDFADVVSAYEHSLKGIIDKSTCNECDPNLDTVEVLGIHSLQLRYSFLLAC